MKFTISNGPLLALVLTTLPNLALSADWVKERKEWTERFELNTSAPTLKIENIWGDVTVSPGPEGEITMKMIELRSAPDQESFERSLEVYPLLINNSDDGVVARVGPEHDRWYRNNPCRHCEVDVQFEVQVPPNTRVYASTINDGEVMVSDIEGLVRAGNVNGPVAVLNARSCDIVESINGDVNLTFASEPGADCQIETINGDIDISVPDGAGLNVAMDLGNGQMVSELPVDPVAIPARVEHREKAGTHYYSIQQAAGVKLAGGGHVFSVTSMNGDLRIQKIN